MSVLSKNIIKFVKSLQLKKNRKEEGLFLVEGGKSVEEVLASDFEVFMVFTTESFLPNIEKFLKKRGLEATIASDNQLADLGTFENNHTALAVVKNKSNAPVNIKEGEYILVLDDIRDPGNLGTIIRAADWYGISKIICSLNSAEFYNPKVIAATMGSFTRVQLYYTDLVNFLGQHKTVQSYGAFLNGKNIHQLSFDPKGGIIVIGNESNGISEAVESFINQKVTIPSFGKAESLNAGVATAIFLDNLRRNQ